MRRLLDKQPGVIFLQHPSPADRIMRSRGTVQRQGVKSAAGEFECAGNGYG